MFGGVLKALHSLSKFNSYQSANYGSWPRIAPKPRNFAIAIYAARPPRAAVDSLPTPGGPRQATRESASNVRASADRELRPFPPFHSIADSRVAPAFRR